jgi:hypothetical protein
MMATVPQVTEREGGFCPQNSARVKENIKSPERGGSGLSSFFMMSGYWRRLPTGSRPPQNLYWRLAPLPFTGRGWKLRSSSQRWTWCFEK